MRSTRQARGSVLGACRALNSSALLARRMQSLLAPQTSRSDRYTGARDHVFLSSPIGSLQSVEIRRVLSRLFTVQNNPVVTGQESRLLRTRSVVPTFYGSGQARGTTPQGQVSSHNHLVYGPEQPSRDRSVATTFTDKVSSPEFLRFRTGQTDNPAGTGQ